MAVVSNGANDDTVEKVDDKAGKAIIIHKFSRDIFVASEIVAWVEQILGVLHPFRSVHPAHKNLIKESI